MRPFSHLSVGILVYLGTTVSATAQTVQVNSSTGLRSALDSASAGTVIDVAAGVYDFDRTLDVAPGISIRGAGRGRTTLRGTWTADLTSRPDDETDFRTADRSAYLLNLGDDAGNVSVSGLTLSGGNGLHGAVYGNNADGFRLQNAAVRDFAWSGLRLFRTDDASITGNHFHDAGGRIDNRTGGAMFLTFQKTSVIGENRITKSDGRDMFGVKGRQFRDTRIHNNTILTSFAVELPFENDSGVTINHNYLDGVVSVPKFRGGVAAGVTDPVPSGDSFRLHNNYLTKAYSIEGPRAGLEVDHNLFDIDPADDRGNLFVTFGDGTDQIIPGELSIHDNLIRNPGRGLIALSRPHENIAFFNNHVLADETVPNTVDTDANLAFFKLPGDRDFDGNGVIDPDEVVDWSTISIQDNLFEVVGGQRRLLGREDSYDIDILNNELINISDAARFTNLATGDPRGPTEPLDFFVGAGNEFRVRGFTLTAVPEPGVASASVIVGLFVLRRRRR